MSGSPDAADILIVFSMQPSLVGDPDLPPRRFIVGAPFEPGAEIGHAPAFQSVGGRCGSPLGVGSYFGRRSPLGVRSALLNLALLRSALGVGSALLNPALLGSPLVIGSALLAPAIVRRRWSRFLGM
jgi:hypothetical protein